MKLEIKKEKKKSCEKFTEMGGQPLFAVEVLKYGMLDADDAEDQKEIPYQGTDSICVYCTYLVFVLDETEVMKAINEAVETVKNLYRIRVHKLVLGSRMVIGWTLGEAVFNSKGEKMREPVENPFESGEVVEYFDSDAMEIRLAIIYKVIDNTLEGNIDVRNRREYVLLLTRGQGMLPDCAQASYVSAPSFPVSERFRKELEDLYKEKLEHVEKDQHLFTDLLDLLERRCHKNETT